MSTPTSSSSLSITTTTATPINSLPDVSVRCINDHQTDVTKVSWRERMELNGFNAMQVGIWAETLHALIQVKEFTHVR